MGSLKYTREDILVRDYEEKIGVAIAIVALCCSIFLIASGILLITLAAPAIEDSSSIVITIMGFILCVPGLLCPIATVRGFRNARAVEKMEQNIIKNGIETSGIMGKIEECFKYGYVNRHRIPYKVYYFTYAYEDLNKELVTLKAKRSVNEETITYLVNNQPFKVLHDGKDVFLLLRLKG